MLATRRVCFARNMPGNTEVVFPLLPPALRRRRSRRLGACQEPHACSVSAGLATIAAHMVRATVCGRARRGDLLVSDWAVVTCATCLKAARPAGRGVFTAIAGSMALAYACPASVGAWLHATCTQEFERSKFGRRLLTSFPDLFRPLSCPRCGAPGADHRDNCDGGAR